MKKIVFIFFLFSVLGCQKIDKLKKPEPLLSKEKMVEIYTDLSYIKAIKSEAHGALNDSRILTKDYFFSKHQIDSAVLSNNLKYYANNLPIYQEILAEVLDSLKIKNNFYENLNQQIIDSEEDSDNYND